MKKIGRKVEKEKFVEFFETQYEMDNNIELIFFKNENQIHMYVNLKFRRKTNMTKEEFKTLVKGKRVIKRRYETEITRVELRKDDVTCVALNT
ncbi:hypothetical protein NNG48_06960 [Enterococcus faecium]|nr:hypothetical protein [Enterococcus faecium]